MPMMVVDSPGWEICFLNGIKVAGADCRHSIVGGFDSTTNESEENEVESKREGGGDILSLY